MSLGRRESDYQGVSKRLAAASKKCCQWRPPHGWRSFHSSSNRILVLATDKTEMIERVLINYVHGKDRDAYLAA